MVKKSDKISWRFIRNGSKKRGKYVSLNETITQRKYIDIHLTNFIGYCHLFLKYKWACGFDVKSAYRNCFIKIQDQELLGYSIHMGHG